MVFYTTDGNASQSEVMRLTADSGMTIASDLDVDGTANLDNTDIDGTFTQDAGAVVFNEAGADYDFRVEGVGEANALFVQGSDGAVGIGESSALYVPLTVAVTEDDVFTAGSNDGINIVLINKSTDATCNTGIKAIDGSSTQDLSAIIFGQTDQTSSNEIGHLEFWTSNSGDSGNTEKMRITSDGNVGIGEAAPGSLLTLKGDDTTVYNDTEASGQMTEGTSLAVHSNTNTTNTFANLVFKLGNTGTAYTRITGIRTGSNLSEMAFITENGSPAEAMRIDSAGSVGIGTAAPGANLEIASASTNAPILRFNRAGDSAITVDDQIGRLQFYGLDSATAPGAYIDIDADGTWDTTTDIHTAPTRIDFHTQDVSADDTLGTPRMTIKSDGNVGINDASPGVKLAVDSGRHSSGLGDTAGGFQIGDIASAGGRLIMGGNGDGHSFIQGSDGTNAYPICLQVSGGNVGIGTSSPSAHLEVMDETIDTTATYVGIYASHVKTAGDTNSSDNFTGVYSSMQFSDADADFGTLWGIRNYVESAAASTDESTEILGIYSRAKMDGNTDVNNIYGTHIVTDVDSGTVDGQVYGMVTDIDVDGGTLSDNIFANKINVNTTQTPGGTIFGLYIGLDGAGLDATADFFTYFYDDVNNDNVAQITALAGVATFDSGDFAGAPDYAEYFESKSGSAIAIGKTVKLDGDKIVACSEGDTPIGVVRPKWSSSVVCGAAPLRWAGKYMKDDYDEVQMEDYTQIKWTEEVDFDEYIKRGKSEEEQRQYSKVEGSKAIEAIEAVEAQDAVYETVVVQEAVEEVLWSEEDELPEGVEAGDVKTEAQEEETEEQLVSEAVQAVEGVEGVDEVPDTYFREHCYHSDRIPEGITAPDDAEVLTPSHQRKKLNPDYDESQDYVKRADRDEWCLIGLLGQIPITKGQPTGSWIKMKDVSDTVEMYFVK